MTVGSLGNIVFTVSSNKIETLTNFKQSGSAAYSEHQRHAGNSLVEFVGRNADTISFEIVLSSELGVNVQTEIDKIAAAEKNGEILKLVIGKKIYGRYRWVIKSHTVNIKHFDKNNEPLLANVNVNLTEYLK